MKASYNRVTDLLGNVLENAHTGRPPEIEAYMHTGLPREQPMAIHSDTHDGAALEQTNGFVLAWGRRYPSRHREGVDILTRFEHPFLQYWDERRV